MCAIVPIIMAVSLAAQASAARQKAKAEKDAADFNAGVENRNAAIAAQQALDARAAGDERAGQIRRQGEQVAGRQRNALAASGIDLTSGTPQELLTQTDFFSTIDQNTAAANAQRTAWGFNETSTNSRMRSQFLRNQSSGIDPNRSFYTTALGGAGSVASSWYGSTRT